MSVQVRITNDFLALIDYISLSHIVAYWADNYHNGQGQWAVLCCAVDTNNEFTHKTAKHAAKEGGGGGREGQTC